MSSAVTISVRVKSVVNVDTEPHLLSVFKVVQVQVAFHSEMEATPLKAMHSRLRYMWSVR